MVIGDDGDDDDDGDEEAIFSRKLGYCRLDFIFYISRWVDVSLLCIIIGPPWPPKIMKFRDFPKNPKKCVFRKKRDIASGDHVVGGLGVFGRKNFMQNLRNVKKWTSLDENLVYFSLR